MRAGRAILAVVFSVLAGPALAQVPGWSYSPLPAEGDRASMGCDREAGPEAFTCLAVRCEDDYLAGVHVHSSRAQGDAGHWEMNIDRENRLSLAMPSEAPYGARFLEDGEWLLERIRHGGYVILRHTDDTESGFAFIDLAGSFRAVHEALAFCAPRLPASE